MNTKSFFIIFFLVGLILISIVPLIKHNTRSKKSYHMFLDTQDFKSLSRIKQVEKCGDCHKEIYKNELDGPHYNSYRILLEHRSFVNSDKYDSCFYTTRVNNVFEDCARCHSPQNLYETLLKDHYSNIDSLVANIIKSPLPKSREGELPRITGVDCFTCHFDGGNLLPLKQTISEDAKKVEQSMHTIAKNNMSCYPCHFDILDVTNLSIAVNKTGSFVCNNCHIEKDAVGNKTHYYYWNADPQHKTNPLTSMLLNDFTFKHFPENRTVAVKWKNNSMPHTLPIATEMIFKITLNDKKGKIISDTLIRINRKSDFDRNMFNELGGRYLDGTVGDIFPIKDGTDYTMGYKLGSTPDSVTITLIRKSQFWIPDSFGSVLRAKSEALN
jgi:hypothetical protein